MSTLKILCPHQMSVLIYINLHTQARHWTDTNGAMVGPMQQIPPHVVRDGGSYQGNRCSMCDKQMEIKCSDCLGGNHFCKLSSLQAHLQPPFHRVSHWTGTHFAPTSLHNLGFKLYLGQNGEHCPSTVDVCKYVFHEAQPNCLELGNSDYPSQS